jgi:transcriptional regulator with XRE-family HTH domain
MSNIAKNVRQLRLEAELTLTELHKRSGLSLAYISKLEDGQYDKLAIRLKTAKSLAEGLGITLSYFFERIGFIQNDDNSPSLSLLKSALRINGELSDKQADNVMNYVEFIKNSSRDGSV